MCVQTPGPETSPASAGMPACRASAATVSGLSPEMILGCTPLRDEAGQRLSGLGPQLVAQADQPERRHVVRQGRRVPVIGQPRRVRVMRDQQHRAAPGLSRLGGLGRERLPLRRAILAGSAR